MNSPPTDRLSSQRIVVTRPAHQAEGFCQLLERASAIVLRCPLLIISPTPDAPSLLRLMEEIESFDLLLFNSPNAVNFGIPQVDARSKLRGRLRIAAIGAKTAQAITSLGYSVDICPDSGFDSESLLKLPVLNDVSGMKIGILRGSGGRDLTGSVLRSRGAEVIYVQVYERQPPTKDQLERIEHTLLGNGVDAVTITSGEAFLALWRGVDFRTRQQLNQTTFLFGSKRLAELARAEGLQALVEIAHDPSDESMFSALTQWAARLPSG